MMKAINRVQDDKEKQAIVEMWAAVKAIPEPLREKWLDYGAGLVDGYKLARRRDQTDEEVQACRE